MFPKQDSGPSEGAWGRGQREGGPSPPGPEGSTHFASGQQESHSPRPAAVPGQGRGSFPAPDAPPRPAPQPRAAGGRPPPPAPCAAAQAPPRLAGPGKEAPGDWPQVTCMGGERLPIGGWPLRRQGRRSRGSSGLPPPPTLSPKWWGRPGTRFTC